MYYKAVMLLEKYEKKLKIDKLNEIKTNVG